MKLLSIIIPTYNVEKYLGKCLESLIVLKSCVDVEVLIVNDGSTDSSPTIAQRYTDTYPDLFYLYNKENGGYGSVINYGIRNASGKYVRILDSDDWFDEVELTTYVEKLRNEDSDIIATSFTMHNMTTGEKRRIEIPKKVEEGKNNLFNETCQLEFIAMHMLTIKKAIYVENKITIDEKTFYTDLEFVIFPIKYIQTISYYNIILYQYRIGISGQSVSHEGMYKYRFDHEKVTIRLIEELNSFLPEDPKYRYVQEKVFEMITVHYRMYGQFPPEKRGLYNEIKNFDLKISSIKSKWLVQSKDLWVNILVKSKFILLKPEQIGYKLKKMNRNR